MPMTKAVMPHTPYTTGTDAPGKTVPTKDTEAMRKRVVDLARQGRKIAERSLVEKRDLTDDEAARIQELLAEADAVADQIDQIKQEKQGAQPSRWPGVDVSAIGDLSDVPSALGGAPQSKAARGAGWAKAVMREASDQFGRFKALTPAGSVLVEVTAPEPVVMGRPVTSLRSLIPAEQTSGVFAFLRQTLRTNNAAVVAPGALKPTSVYNFERVQDTAKVIAHLSEPIPRQDLSDAPLLQAFVHSEMFFGLEQALEAEIITGSGTGEHIEGMANTAGIQTVPLITGGPSTAIDLVRTLRRALTRLEGYGLTGTGWVMNPADWEKVETLATTGGELLMASAGQQVPVDQAARRLWGIPVVSTPSCPAGVAYLADFLGSTKLYVREEANLSWSENTWDPDALGEGLGASDFARNLVRFRAEGRFGFAVTRPTGVVKVALA